MVHLSALNNVDSNSGVVVNICIGLGALLINIAPELELTVLVNTFGQLKARKTNF